MKKEYAHPPWFSLNFRGLPVKTRIPFDLYLEKNHASEPVLFQHSGKALTHGQILALTSDPIFNNFLVRTENRQECMELIQDSLEELFKVQKIGELIRLKALFFIQDLFYTEDANEGFSEGPEVIQNIVHFIQSHPDSLTTLMPKSSFGDDYIFTHSVNVAAYSVALVQKIKGNDYEILSIAAFGGLLHDIGKRKIDARIITKASRLEEQEWTEIKKHPVYGFNYLKEVSTIPDDAKRIILEHHENFDGSGYPRGVKTEQISMLSQIVAFADVFDALTTKQPFRNAMSVQAALATMLAMQPNKFDPEIFSGFIKDFKQKHVQAFVEDLDPSTPPKPKH